MIIPVIPAAPMVLEAITAGFFVVKRVDGVVMATAEMANKKKYFSRMKGNRVVFVWLRTATALTYSTPTRYMT
jgi:hypothetical protein